MALHLVIPDDDQDAVRRLRASRSSRAPGEDQSRHRRAGLIRERTQITADLIRACRLISQTGRGTAHIDVAVAFAAGTPINAVA